MQQAHPIDIIRPVKIKCITFITALFLLPLSFMLKLNAHEWEQMYFEIEVQPNQWKASIAFDAAYAVPELRDDPEAKQPDRAWLYELTDTQHAAMRKEAERYLRDYILFSYLAESQDTDKAEQLDLTFLFPDWQLASENKENQAAPNFPVLMSGGAYFNIEIHGTFPKKNGDFIVSVTQSKENLPDLFFSINKGSAPEKVIKPGESFTILTRNMKEPKWLYNIVSSSIRPIDNDLSLKLPSEDSPSLPSGDGSTENHLFDDLQNLESEDVEITIHQPSYTSHLWEKFSLGFRHVIPSGLDHILFIIASERVRYQIITGEDRLVLAPHL